MNERIKLLAEQANALARENVEYSRTEGWDIFTEKLYEVSREKFAELIVKRIIDNVECHASLFNTKEARQVCSWIVKSVKYDFGVE